MRTVEEFPVPHKNRILTSLPPEESQRLRRYQEIVRLTAGKILYNPGDHIRYLYFPLGGMVSLLSTTSDGASIEVGMIGNEGVVGLPAVLGIPTSPYQLMVQLAGSGVRVRVEAVREEFNRRGRLHDLLLTYLHTLLVQLGQSAACNRFHTLEERLCRWLLISRDRVNSNTIRLTQEFISHMLGVPRTSVSTTANNLQRAKLISYSRGKIQILDPRRMEEVSCECYAIIKEDLTRFLAA